LHLILAEIIIFAFPLFADRTHGFLLVPARSSLLNEVHNTSQAFARSRLRLLMYLGKFICQFPFLTGGASEFVVVSGITIVTTTADADADAAGDGVISHLVGVLLRACRMQVLSHTCATSPFTGTLVPLGLGEIVLCYFPVLAGAAPELLRFFATAWAAVPLVCY
jgi:hypothetical protein